MTDTAAKTPDVVLQEAVDLLHGVLDQLAPEHSRPTAGVERLEPNPSLGLPAAFLRAYGRLYRVLQKYQPACDALGTPTFDRLRNTHDKLGDVMLATESAANGILDGLDRSIAMVDDLDAMDASGDPGAADIRARLRDELFQVMGYLQFQDITTQQLTSASSMLIDMEARLGEAAQGIDRDAVRPVMPAPPPPGTFDPRASYQDTYHRQALVDRLIASSTPD